MMRAARILAVGLLAVLIAACGSAPVPDTAYYQMPATVPGTVHTEPPIAVPVVVDVFLSDGMHGEQGVLYRAKPGGAVKSYHYQLWNDAPARLLQRRIIERLRAENVAVMVSDRLPDSLSSLRISGVIDQFEREQFEPDRWRARVRVEMRVDIAENELPVLLKVYGADIEAEGATMQATVRAFAKATDQMLAEFTQDLIALQL